MTLALEFRFPRAAGPAAAAACLSMLAAGCAEPKAAAAADPRPHVQASDPVAAGRYLVVVGGCNDCHTPGWTEGGEVAESQWLTGTNVGWRGPWGTTYPPNLRLLADRIDEDEFVAMLHTRKDLPPMPWMNVNRLHEADARALYRFLKALGPAGEPAPPALGPDETPTGPFVPMAPPTIIGAQTKHSGPAL